MFCWPSSKDNVELVVNHPREVRSLVRQSAAACEAGARYQNDRDLLSPRRQQVHHFHFGEACSRSCKAKASAAWAASLNCLRSSAHSSPLDASLPSLALSLSISLPSSSKRRRQRTVAPNLVGQLLALFSSCNYCRTALVSAP